MKLLRTISQTCTVAFLLTLAPSIFAAEVGPYLGFGGGKGIVHIPDKPFFTGSSTRSESGFAARGFLGYTLSRYAGVEAAYARFPRALYVGRYQGAYSSIAYYYRTYTLVAKAYLPVANSGIDIYGLAGIARVVGRISYTNNGIPQASDLAAPPNGLSHTYNNRPTYGLGINYSFSQRLMGNIEMSRVQKLNSFSNTPNAIPSLDLITLNIAYRFC